MLGTQADIELVPEKVSCVNPLWPKHVNRSDAEKQMNNVLTAKEAICPRWLRFTRTPTNMQDLVDNPAEV